MLLNVCCSLECVYTFLFFLSFPVQAALYFEQGNRIRKVDGLAVGYLVSCQNSNASLLNLKPSQLLSSLFTWRVSAALAHSLVQSYRLSFLLPLVQMVVFCCALCLCVFCACIFLFKAQHVQG